MTTTRKLWLGFGTLTILLLSSYVAFLVGLRSLDERFETFASVASPMRAAAQELEIDVNEIGMSVLDYLRTADVVLRERIAGDARNFDKHKAAFDELATSAEHQAQSRRLEASFREYEALATALMTQRDRGQVRSEDVKRFSALRLDLDALLDEEIQRLQQETFEDANDAADRVSHQLQLAVGILLAIGMLLAAITSTLVGRSILRSEETLRVTLTGIGDAVIATDAAGLVTFLNPVAESLTGWLQGDAAGQPLAAIFRIVDEETRQPVDDPASKALREGRIVGLANHTVLIAKDGTERPIDDSAAPIRDANGKITGVVLVFRDVTERRTAERALLATAAKLSEADRHKNEFLAILAHELRNPLAPIHIGLQIVQAAGADEDKKRSALGIVQRQLALITRLVDDLLDVGRIGTGKMELRKHRIELAPVLDQAVEAARPRCERMSQNLIVNLAPEPIYVNADPVRLVQVVGNLLSNACKFTPAGGRVALSLERDDSDAVIRVRDAGVGIEADRLQQIFELFMQVDTFSERSHGGLGIGLALAKKITELHDGTIEARSEGIGRGSEFVIRLPVHIQSSDDVAKIHDGGREKAPRCRILIVDDNQDSADSLAMLLKLGGHEVRTASNGVEALDTAAAFTPEVILLDIGLPDINGHEVGRRIRAKQGASVFMVAVTGWGQDDDRHRSAEAGFDAHIVKPMNAATFEKLLAERASRIA